ncbi:rRNA methyltransferase [Pilimelia terevasa]|uniref:rRNA methyltransferase n=1 Tax=Pilimelia terevasa TaxID=53372 RepID=A0A8J3BNQ7_9ACTN|nr:RNA methyltransferase [Pilimelia terevasa]GGK34554.1 rRNA methyltransferase [Pilimelia terevasa]
MSAAHVRHRPPTALERPREIVVACAPLRSQVNLSTILRAAGCCGITTVYATGNVRPDPAVARDSLGQIEVRAHRSLAPVLRQLRADGYRLVGLEQTTDSANLHTFAFPRRTALVVGNERQGLKDEELALMDDCVEIPVWGMPHSHNVATATAMALYEYCRQYPAG